MISSDPDAFKTIVEESLVRHVNAINALADAGMNMSFFKLIDLLRCYSLKLCISYSIVLSFESLHDHRLCADNVVQQFYCCIVFFMKRIEKFAEGQE